MRLLTIIRQAGRFRSEGALRGASSVVGEHVSGAGVTGHHIVCPRRGPCVDEKEFFRSSESIPCLYKVIKME